MSDGFVLRAPWYVRERGDFDLNSPRALRPTLQKYATADFVDQVLRDPRDSLRFVADDRWSYPVPITPTTAKGRERFATHKLCITRMRKLYQPTHDRHYTVVVEVFCDQPGWPRAGGHEELEVGFVMRRRQTTLSGDPKTVRRLARNLLVSSAQQRSAAHASPGRTTSQSPVARTAVTLADSPDLLAAEQAWQQQFVEDNGDLIAAIKAEHQVQAWMVNGAGGVWRDLGAEPPADEALRTEEEWPMWRLPPTAAGCEEASSRSLWFGVVPTFSAEHWVGPGDDNPLLSKLDDHEVYELVCFVRQPRPDCPPRIWWGKPSQPFRLAAPFDPDGTKNHAVTITAPDLRRLAARAGRPLGPGGARIVTPPESGLPPPPVGDLGKVSNLKLGGDSICFFAFELFFLVALFLFLLFLPIIVFLFQLWWMLALKFCIPPAISGAFEALVTFLDNGGDLPLDPLDQAELKLMGQLDAVLQMPGAAAQLQTVDPFKTPPTAVGDLVAAIDPATSAEPPPPLPVLRKPDDPLCPPAG